MNTLNMPGFTAESSLSRIRGYSYAENSGEPQQSSASQITPQACTRRCRDIIRPELCLIPFAFPWCLLPQHVCDTVCDVP
jgi:hypothetical protein